MLAKKKISIQKTDPVDKALRKAIGKLDISDQSIEALLKDCHLIEAALNSDCRVVSLDETVRALLADVALRQPRIRKITWVNPTKTDDEAPIDWLSAGAPHEPKRQLGGKPQRKQNN